MTNAQLKKIEIINDLSFVPADKLDDIKNFVEYVLYTSKVKKRKPISVRGIWKNKGFENLDIEKELKAIRSEVQSNLVQNSYD